MGFFGSKAAAPAAEKVPLLGQSRPLHADFHFYKPDSRDYRNWGFLEFCFAFRGTALYTAALPTLGALLVTTAWILMKKDKMENTVVAKYGKYYVSLDPLAHQLTIIPIGFLLVVRTNLAYSRWWGGRVAMGKFILHSREIAMKAMSFIVGDDMEKVNNLRRGFMQYLQAAFILMSHNLHKRTYGQRGDPKECKDILTENEIAVLEKVPKNRPLHVMSWMRKLLTEATPLLVSPHAFEGFDADIKGLLAAWQEAATICTCPMPMPYAHLLKMLLYVWTYTLPLVIVEKAWDEKMGSWAAIAFMFAISITLFGLDGIGYEIEDPFGDDENDLPLKSFISNVHMDLCYLGMDAKYGVIDLGVQPVRPFEINPDQVHEVDLEMEPTHRGMVSM